MVCAMSTDRVARLTGQSPAELANEDFLLIGESTPTAFPPNEPVAAGYAVFDARLLADGTSRANAALGRIELVIHPRSLLIDGLSRMEISAGRRQRGAGRRLIQALAATAPNFHLAIYDIRPVAMDFWIALGCAFQPRPDGWDGSYTLPTNLRPAPAETRIEARVESRSDRAEALLRL
jgi:hypothetical protein